MMKNKDVKITKNDLIKVNEVTWKIPPSFNPQMHVPAFIYASEEMLEDFLKDYALEQLVNVAALPGIQRASFGMPDIHEGYGFPIGGVAATTYPDGVISPGGIGYDINCGVRLLISDLSFSNIKKQLPELSKKLYQWVPSGVGKGGQFKLDAPSLNEVLAKGLQWCLENNYATELDLQHCESQGTLINAQPEKVSDLAKQRGSDQLGTIGAGNHFVEVDVVESVYDESIAQAFGLKPDQIVVLIHTGSRGLGHQVATDYIKVMLNCMEEKYNVILPDQELAAVPLSSPEGQSYFNAMAAAANFAWTNRQLITWEVRQAWQQVFGSDHKLNLLYDVAHNIAKIERHIVDGKDQDLIVHRKGATRAFGPGNPELPPIFQTTGQPVLIPGSMGTASYVLAGSQSEETFSSCCHGAGRRLSRYQALKTMSGRVLFDQLAAKGIHVQTGSMRSLPEEAPHAYKDIDGVVDVVAQAGIAKKVVRVKPCAVVKG